MLALALSPEPPDSERLLHPLLSRHYLTDIIKDTSQKGVFKTMQDKAECPYLPKTQEGFDAWGYRCGYLAMELDKHGFKHREPNNLYRIEAPEGMSIPRIRLVLCKGEQEGEIVLVREKGPYTRVLVEENAKLDPQLKLPFEDEEPLTEQDWITIWIFAHMSKTGMLKVAVAVVGDISPDGTKMKYWDYEELGTFDMNLYEKSSTPTVEPLPSSIPNPFLLEDLPPTGTDNENP